MKYLFFLLLVGNVLVYLWESRLGVERTSVDRIEVRLPQDVEKLVLIDELPEIPRKPLVNVEPKAAAPDGESAPETPEAQTPAAMAAQPEPAPGCYLVGPFSSEGKGKQALARIKASFAGTTELVSRTDAVADGYWVLYPKADNIYAARANRKMLAEKGIRDMWVFDRGEWENAISLGLFNSRERADAWQQQLREKQGIEVEVRPRLTRSQAYWLKLSVDGGQSGVEQAVEQLKADRAADASTAVKACD